MDYRKEKIIEAFNQNTVPEKDLILSIFSDLEEGKIFVCEKVDNEWIINDWIKMAILLSFKVFNSSQIYNYISYDKIPLRFEKKPFKKGRQVPGSIVRASACIKEGAILMPSFINVGAYVGEKTMIDTWSTVGSCARIGKNCHISGGVGIGGVLEPIQARPVIIEDNCFIGARSEIAEGVLIEEGSVISMGVFIGSSTKIVDRESGEITFGKIPSYSVVVPGSIESKNGVSLSCAVIVKRVDEKTRSKVSITELLR